jgi:regulatory protein
LNPDIAENGAGEDQPSLNDLRIYAGRLLARREYAVAELRAKLERKWSARAPVRQLVRELIEALQEEGALSEQRFADSFVRSRINRFHGPIKIRAELRERQVPENIIETSLEPLAEEWVSLAAAWVSRHQPGGLDFAHRAKVHRRLVNRGFTQQQAREALSRH